MSNTHILSFFGQNTGIIIKSTSKFKSYMFVQCIKKNQEGKWEKPSANEGRTIKFTLEEILLILQVISRRTLSWKNFHIYNGKKTSFSFSWEDEKMKVLWINIADYSKLLNFAQVEILRLLLKHIIEEKVVFSTTYTKNIDKEKSAINYGYLESEQKFYQDNNDLLKNRSKIKAILTNETEKALLLKFGPTETHWIPKSSIHNHYLPRKNFNQFFLIDNWVLEKNKIPSNLQ